MDAGQTQFQIPVSPQVPQSMEHQKQQQSTKQQTDKSPLQQQQSLKHQLQLHYEANIAAFGGSNEKIKDAQSKSLLNNLQDDSRPAIKVEGNNSARGRELGVDHSYSSCGTPSPDNLNMLSPMMMMQRQQNNMHLSSMASVGAPTMGSPMFPPSFAALTGQLMMPPPMPTLPAMHGVGGSSAATSVATLTAASPAEAMQQRNLSTLSAFSSDASAANSPQQAAHPHSGPGTPGYDFSEEAASKRELRLYKNRQAARASRSKKKEYYKCLENRVYVLEQQNKAMVEELRAYSDLYHKMNKPQI